MRLDFDVSGMTCAACSARVEKVASAVSGVTNVSVNLLAGKMQVEVENAECSKLIIEAVRNAGYGASIHGNAKKNENK